MVASYGIICRICPAHGEKWKPRGQWYGFSRRGTPSVGHLLLDAYHATGDEYYYEAAQKVANTLIWGQLECGGWNYVFDFAGENSLKSWYDTVGKNGWRLEEFQHYYWKCDL